MVFRLLPLVLLAASAAADFSDDFESYTPGQDPEASGDWLRSEYGGHAWVASLGGGQVLEAAFEDSLAVGYVCTAAGDWDDGSVGMSFSPDGDGAYCCVLARMVTSGETYAGGLVTVMQPVTTAFLAYVNASGDFEVLWSGFGPFVSQGEWVDLEMTLEGSTDVVLTLYCDGSLAGTATDAVHALGPGLSGFAMLRDPEEVVPGVSADDFEVVLDPSSLESRTFAQIKRLL
ncbi:MAG: hypothetical protein QUS11_00150 [Candidatus Fermentibacter sp.]|nr:hypothetical protein [Candidatus Fermentibacter sp.]